MSAAIANLTVDPIVDARITDILGEVGRVAASLDVAACLLTTSDGDLGRDVDAAHLGLALKVARDHLLAQMDRLDCVNLYDPSRRLVVTSVNHQEVTILD